MKSSLDYTRERFQNYTRDTSELKTWLNGRYLQGLVLEVDTSTRNKWATREAVLPGIINSLTKRCAFLSRSPLEAVEYPPGWALSEVEASQPLGKYCPIIVSTTAEKTEGTAPMRFKDHSFWVSNVSEFKRQADMYVSAAATVRPLPEPPVEPVSLLVEPLAEVQPFTCLPALDYLESVLSGPLHLALVEVGRLRPLDPTLGARGSALRMLSLYL